MLVKSNQFLKRIHPILIIPLLDVSLDLNWVLSIKFYQTKQVLLTVNIFLAFLLRYFGILSFPLEIFSYKI